MILSDRDIKKYISLGDITLTPYEEKNVQPASIDLRLGQGFLVVDDHKASIIDLNEEVPYRRIDEDYIVIPPKHFVLGTTEERLKISSNLCARVEGRSSIGRKGLFIQNAGWIDPGFNGQITLEFYNANDLPLILKAGKRICQVVFQTTLGEVENPYKGKYQNQEGTTGSKSHLDIENQ